MLFSAQKLFFKNFKNTLQLMMGNAQNGLVNLSTAPKMRVVKALLNDTSPLKMHCVKTTLLKSTGIT